MLRSLSLCVVSALLAAGCGEKSDDGDDSGSVTDLDGDGYSSDVDCDDGDPGVNPDAQESCNLGDDDCDGQVDEGVTTTFFADSDGDGAGDPSATLETCSQPQGYVSAGDDCDDSDASAAPNINEVCDGVDNNCDGEADEGVTTTFFADADGDGFGDPNATVEACEEGDGATTDDTDCDDGDASAFPGANEVCDGADNDCDGVAEAGGDVSWTTSTDGIGGWSDVSADFSVGGDGPAQWASSQDGALCFAAGTHPVSMTLEHSVSVMGVGEALTTLTTNASGSVLVAAAESLAVTVSDLTLDDGAAIQTDVCGFTAGSTVRSSGGLLCCEGQGTSLHVERVTMSGGHAEVGGALYTEDCDTSIVDSTITDGFTTLGGSAAIYNGGSHIVEHSDFSLNITDGDGGALYLISSSSTLTEVTISDSLFEGNAAGDDGGALFLAGSTSGQTANVSATGTRFISNEAAAEGGAIFLYRFGTFDCQGCDLGENSEDNLPDDIYIGELGSGETHGDGVSLSCDETGCQ